MVPFVAVPCIHSGCRSREFSSAPDCLLFTPETQTCWTLSQSSAGHSGRDLVTFIKFYLTRNITGVNSDTILSFDSRPNDLTSWQTSVACPAEPPLTWRLTEVDKLCIQRDWSQIKPRLVATIREFLASRAKTPLTRPAGTYETNRSARECISRS